MTAALRISHGPTIISQAVDALRSYLQDNYSDWEKIPEEHELAETQGVKWGTLRAALIIRYIYFIE